MYTACFRMTTSICNGWFADYILIRKGGFAPFFNVSDLDLDSRILIEPVRSADPCGRARKDHRYSALQ